MEGSHGGVPWRGSNTKEHGITPRSRFVCGSSLGKWDNLEIFNVLLHCLNKTICQLTVKVHSLQSRQYTIGIICIHYISLSR